MRMPVFVDKQLSIDVSLADEYGLFAAGPPRDTPLNGTS